MKYKATPVYIVMRHDNVANLHIPVAVFNDNETATGNAEGYTEDMKERGFPEITFDVSLTTYYS
jgi:hypothetical protein